MWLGRAGGAAVGVLGPGHCATVPLHCLAPSAGPHALPWLLVRDDRSQRLYRPHRVPVVFVSEAPAASFRAVQ